MKHRIFSLLSLVAISSLVFLNLFLTLQPTFALEQNSLNNQQLAAAIDTVREGVDGTADAPGIGLPGGEPEQLVGKIINVILAFLGVIFLILTIYAGFLWMTASGEEKKVAKAKGILSSSVTGLVIILAAYLLVNFVIFTLIIPSAS